MILPQGWFSDADIQAYSVLAENVKEEGRIVELGCWKGRSICSIAEIIKRRKLRVRLVDTFEGTENEGEAHAEAKRVDLREILISNLRQFAIYDKCEVSKCRTDDAVMLRHLTEKEDYKIDLLFIDADHSTEGVKRDILNWLPLMSEEAMIAGHDILWPSVVQALTELNIINSVVVKGNVWAIEVKKAKELMYQKVVQNKDSRPKVNCVVCTKDRYLSSLPITLLSILNQTVKPDYLHVYDDSDNKYNLLNEPLYDNIFRLLERSGIVWKFIPTSKKGQVANHQKSKEESPCDWIWRVDDDVFIESDVLEKLLKVATCGDETIGAIAPMIPTRGFEGIKDINNCSGFIKDIDDKANIQWLDVPNLTDVIQVDHLHCSFLYNRTRMGDYSKELSLVGHREETMFTYESTLNGYKQLIDTSARCYHFKQPNGGIRTGVREMFERDEVVFRGWLDKTRKAHSYKSNSEGALEKEGRFVYLDNGLGDHICFKDTMNTDKYLYLVACCFPEVFEGMPNVKIVSLAAGRKVLEQQNKSSEDFSIYKFMWDNSLSGNRMSLSEAFTKMYE